MADQLPNEKDLVALYTQPDPKEYYKKKLYLYIALIVFIDLIIVMGFLYYYFYRRGGLPVFSDFVDQVRIGSSLEKKVVNRTDSRKTGILYQTVDGEVKRLNWCPKTDGAIYQQYDQGLTIDNRIMSTRIRKVLTDNEISVYTDSGGTYMNYSVLSVVLKDPTNGGNVQASLGDLEEGDCVLIDGIKNGQLVTVYGLK